MGSLDMVFVKDVTVQRLITRISGILRVLGAIEMRPRVRSQRLRGMCRVSPSNLLSN